MPARNLTTTPFSSALIARWHAFHQTRDLATKTIVVIATNATVGAAGVGLLLKLESSLHLDACTNSLVLAAVGKSAIIPATFTPQTRAKIGSRAAFA